MNNLSDKQLKRLIREAITRHEACCLARHSPMYGIEIQSTPGLYRDTKGRKELVKGLANIIQNRADLSGKDWDAMRRDWEIMLRFYGKNVNQRYEQLDACHIDTPGALGKDEVDACGADEAFVSADDEEEDFYSTSSDPTLTLPIGERAVKSMIREALTVADETAIKKMIAKELSASQTDVGKSLKKAVEEELSKALKSKDIKDDITDITKKVMKRLYKDLSYHHPYIIDRIKV
jgi:hypothetical protein